MAQSARVAFDVKNIQGSVVLTRCVVAQSECIYVFIWDEFRSVGRAITCYHFGQQTNTYQHIKIKCLQMCRLTGSHKCWREWPANLTQDHIIRIRKIIFCLSNDAPSHVVGIYTSTLDGKYYCNITPTASDRVSTVTHLYSLWDDDGSVCANVTLPTWQTMETSAFIVMARFGGVGAG